MGLFSERRRYLIILYCIYYFYVFKYLKLAIKYIVLATIQSNLNKLLINIFVNFFSAFNASGRTLQQTISFQTEGRRSWESKDRTSSHCLKHDHRNANSGQSELLWIWKWKALFVFIETLFISQGVQILNIISMLYYYKTSWLN
jgi:hypothetical protein